MQKNRMEEASMGPGALNFSRLDEASEAHNSAFRHFFCSIALSYLKIPNIIFLEFFEMVSVAFYLPRTYFASERFLF